MSYRDAAPIGLVFTSLRGTVAALDPTTGEARWKQQLGVVSSAPVLRAAGGRLYVCAAGVLRAFEAATGNLLWRIVVPIDLGAADPTLDVLGDTVLLAHGDMVYAYFTGDGSSGWQTRSQAVTIER